MIRAENKDGYSRYNRQFTPPLQSNKDVSFGALESQICFQQILQR